MTPDVSYDQIFGVTAPVTVTGETCTKIKGELPSGIGGYQWSAKLIHVLAPCKYQVRSHNEKELTMRRTLTGVTVAIVLAAACFGLGAGTVGDARARGEATKLHILVSRGVAITGLRGVDSAVAHCPSGYLAFSGAFQTTAGSDVEILTATPTRDNGFGVTAYAGPLSHKATIVVKALCLERDQAYITVVG